MLWKLRFAPLLNKGGMPTSRGRSRSAFGIPVPVPDIQVKSIQKQQTTIRQPIECAPEASRGGREWAEMTESKQASKLA